VIPFLTTLPPDAATILLTLGLALIALELNRPGWILPGSAGLLLALLSLASLFRLHPSPRIVIGLIASMALLLLQLRRPVHLFLILGATILLILCLVYWVPTTAPARISAPTAIVCGLFLGAGTTVLTRLARRARRNKGLD
jgi:membrane-bound ClpP family serine protease